VLLNRPKHQISGGGAYLYCYPQLVASPHSLKTAEGVGNLANQLPAAWNGMPASLLNSDRSLNNFRHSQWRLFFSGDSMMLLRIPCLCDRFLLIVRLKILFF